MMKIYPHLNLIAAGETECGLNFCALSLFSKSQQGWKEKLLGFFWLQPCCLIFLILILTWTSSVPLTPSGSRYSSHCLKLIGLCLFWGRRSNDPSLVLLCWLNRQHSVSRFGWSQFALYFVMEATSCSIRVYHCLWAPLWANSRIPFNFFLTFQWIVSMSSIP